MTGAAIYLVGWALMLTAVGSPSQLSGAPLLAFLALSLPVVMAGLTLVMLVLGFLAIS
jgi:hypothetical protein